MISSTSHLFLYLWARPGWQAELWTEAGSVSFGCSDWRAWGRGCRRWARQRTPSSLTTWLDGWRPGGGRVELSISCSASQWRHVWTVSSGPLPLLRRRSDQHHLHGVCVWANPVFLPVLRPDWRRRACNCTWISDKDVSVLSSVCFPTFFQHSKENHPEKRVLLVDRKLRAANWTHTDNNKCSLGLFDCDSTPP